MILWKLPILVLSATCLLSGGELHADEQTKPIILQTALQNSQPKYYIDEAGEVSGLCVDILRAIMRVEPRIKIEWRERYLPFKRIQRELEKGNLDLFAGLLKSPAREERFEYLLIPLYPMHHTVAQRRSDDATITSMEDFRRPEFAGDFVSLTGSAGVRRLRSFSDIGEVHEAQKLEQAMRMLMANRVRYVYYHNLGLADAIRTLNLQSEVRLSDAVLYGYHHYLAVSPTLPQGSKALLVDTLQTLSDSGELARIYARYVALGESPSQ